MRLWSERTHRIDWLHRPIYKLALMVEVSAEERELIHRHGLAVADVWLSPTALTLHAEAEGAFENTRTVRSWRWRGIGATFGHIIYGYVLAYRSRGEPHVPVGALMSGIVLEAREVAELIATETGVRNGVEQLDIKLKHLASYDTGDETTTDTEKNDPATHPGSWIRMRHK